METKGAQIDDCYLHNDWLITDGVLLVVDHQGTMFASKKEYSTHSCRRFVCFL